MNTASPDHPETAKQLGIWQFGPRNIIVATIGVAEVLGFAVIAGWIYSELAVCFVMAVLAVAFSSAARRVLFGSVAILTVFVLAEIPGDLLLALLGVEDSGRKSWLFAGLLLICALFLRRFTRSSSISLATSLLVVEACWAMAIVSLGLIPFSYQACVDNRWSHMIEPLRHYFFIARQWFLVAPWLMGIFLGEFLARRKRNGHR